MLYQTDTVIYSLDKNRTEQLLKVIFLRLAKDNTELISIYIEIMQRCIHYERMSVYSSDIDGSTDVYRRPRLDSNIVSLNWTLLLHVTTRLNVVVFEAAARNARLKKPFYAQTTLQNIMTWCLILLVCGVSQLEFQGLNFSPADSTIYVLYIITRLKTKKLE